MKKLNAGTEEKKQSIINTVSVNRVKTDKNGIIRFDLTVNGVTIYGCNWREGKDKNGNDYAFVTFPSYKGSNDKWYNNAYIPLTAEDTEKINGLLVEALTFTAD